MIKKILIAMIVVLTMLGITGCGFNKSSNKYKKDAKFVYDFLYNYTPTMKYRDELYNKDFFKIFRDEIDRFDNCKSDDEFYTMMNSLLLKSEEGHLTLLNENAYKYISNRIKVMKEDIDISGYSDELKRMVRTADEMYAYIDNNELTKKLYHLDGMPIIRNQNADDTPDMEITFKNIDDDTAYIKIPIFTNSSTDDLKSNEKIMGYLKSIKGKGRLIIDIRDNPGGHSEYWERFLLPNILKDKIGFEAYNFIDFDKKTFADKMMANIVDKYIDCLGLTNLTDERLKTLDIKDKERLKSAKMYAENKIQYSPSKDSVKYEGNIYLLANENTQSAALLLVNTAKSTGFAKVASKGAVGVRTTNGADNLCFPLPNTGYVIQVPVSYIINQKGTIRDMFEIQPDIKLEDSEAKGESGDFELDSLINHIKQKSQ